jgi:hypothetical protein
MKPMPKHERGSADVITERQRVEYDRFGPWAYLVSEPQEMPPRFDLWYEELRSSTLVIKLPVAVERKAAKPGSDLYEGILAVGSSGIVSLSFSRGEVLRRDVAFGEIAAISLAQELLYGEMRIDLADGGALSVVFNTVSADLLGDFIDEVRRECAAAGAKRLFPGVRHSAEPPEEDTLFQIRIRALRRRDPGFAVLAYQAPCVLVPAKDGGRRSLLGLAAGLLRWRLDGCLLAVVPSELAVLVRGSWTPRTGKARGYRYESVYIPASAFRGAVAEARSHANGASLHVLRLSTAGRGYELLFEAEPSEALAALGRD